MISTRNPHRISTLSLEFHTLSNPDWPVLRILVDGQDPFTGVAPEWAGFDPDAILGHGSPLLPLDGAGRRVAVYRCSCGIEGCGVIAPVILPSLDRRLVSWVDFRDFVGVFEGPLPLNLDHEGKPWDLPDIHFAHDQYVAEVERACRDRSWETPGRRTTRLLRQYLEAPGFPLPSHYFLEWIAPSSDSEEMVLMFRSSNGASEHSRQREVRLTSRHRDPGSAAAEMAGLLRADPIYDRESRFKSLGAIRSP
ncbi:MAG: hypothetical protein QM582_00145 [Micropruina sp.]|uniref:hypothetical protein n=1 Tax=Micropruina sp. TaxID=2737536 RepID=UPI0039E59D7F